MRLTARKRRCLLAEFDVGQPYIHECAQFRFDAWNVGKQLERLFNGHIEHIGDRFALKPYRNCLGVIAFSTADLARHIHVGKEVHFDLPNAYALALLTSAACNIETESSCLVSSNLRFRKHCEEVSDLREETCIGRRVRSRCSTNWGLIDFNHFINMFKSYNFFIF